jgi:uncharacterized membrane protein
MTPLHRRAAPFRRPSVFALVVASTAFAGCLVEGDAVYERAEAPEAGGADGSGGATGGAAGGATGGEGGAAGPTFAEVEPILIARCGPCHGATPSRGAPFPLTDYASAAARAERSAIRAEEGSMPPPGQGVEPCTADEIRRLRLWADADAPE